MGLLDFIMVPQDKQQRLVEKQRADAYTALLHWSAKVGGELFGPVPKGNRREFFCLDERTWVWHEEWKDTTGKQHIVTTRYDVRPNGVYKSQGSNSYQALSTEEARNLFNAIELYYQRVMPELAKVQ
jgi:hypothetical protein